MRVGSLFGIPIHLHISLLLFLFVVLYRSSLSIGHLLEYAALVILSVLLHELGHALTAKRFRLSGLSIMLHGFGGYAVSTGRRTWQQDLTIVLMGPAVTFVVGGVAFAIGHYGFAAATEGSEAFTQFYLIEALGRLNLLLGVLNLIPSLPFDGGMALAAIFSRRQPYPKALRVAAHLGLVITPVISLVGLFEDWSLVAFFGLMGLVTSFGTLLNSGGIRFGEVFADRRARKEDEAAKRRAQAKKEIFLGDVMAREKEREERERLRKILEASIEEK